MTAALAPGELRRGRVACIACSGSLVAWLQEVGYEVAASLDGAAAVIVDVSAGLEHAIVAPSRPLVPRIGVNVPVEGDAALRLADAGFDEVVFATAPREELVLRLRVALQRGTPSGGWERAIVDAVADGIIVLDGDGIVEMLNPAAEHLFAVAAPDVVGGPVVRLIPPELQPRGVPAFSRPAALALGAGREARLEILGQRPDKTTFPAELAITAMQIEGQQKYAALVRDLTGQRDAEGALRRSEQRYRQAVESLQDVYYRLDAKGVVVDASPSCVQQTGYRREELIGTRVSRLCVTDDNYAAAARALVSGEQVHDLEIAIRRKDGHELPMSMNASVIVDADGRFVGVQGTLRDISDRKRAEREQEDFMAVLEANALVLAQQAAELDSLRAEAEYQASHDTLTGVLNRRAWFAAAVNERHSALAIFDIDYFKRVNDTYGHPAGDAVLQEVAGRLGAVFGDNALGRVGGEEFGVLFSVPLLEARTLCEDGLAAFGQPIILATGETLMITLSAGLAPWRPGKHSREESLARTYDEADHLLYRAKEQGRARLVSSWPLAA